MSEWRDISTAPRNGVFVLLHNDRWSSDVKDFGTRAVSPGLPTRASRASKTA